MKRELLSLNLVRYAFVRRRQHIMRAWRPLNADCSRPDSDAAGHLLATVVIGGGGVDSV